MTTILAIDKLTVRFGGLTAVNGVDLHVRAGEIFSIIGPNGAGKTTIFNAITGLNEPAEGRIVFQGRPLARAWTWRTTAALLTIALATAAAAFLLALGIDSFWQQVIRDHYRNRQEPFPWHQAAITAGRYLADRQETLAFAFTLGLLTGAAGLVLTWQRSRHAPDAIAQRGIARTFQNIRLFPSMTVRENVLVGLDRQRRESGWGMLLHTRAHRRREADAQAQADQWLAFVGLKHRPHALASSLPYGDQRRLEIARALATHPTLLLLDEPAAGMNPSETAELLRLIQRIRDRGITVLLIEHHMNVVMAVSDRVAVLDHGVKIAEGTPQDVRGNPRVIEAYLGKEDESAASCPPDTRDEA